jgi:hypothetical protein
VAVLAPGAAVAQTAAQDPGGREGDNEGLLRQLDAARVSRNSETGTVSLIGTNNADPIERPAGLSPGASPATAARAHLEEVGPPLGVEDPSRELELQDTEGVGKGRSVTRFRQVHKDVPVLGGEINVQTNGSNELLRITSSGGFDDLRGDQGNDFIDVADGSGGDVVDCGENAGDNNTVDYDGPTQTSLGDTVTNCEVLRPSSLTGPGVLRHSGRSLAR